MICKVDSKASPFRVIEMLVLLSFFKIFPFLNQEAAANGNAFPLQVNFRVSLCETNVSFGRPLMIKEVAEK